MSPWVANTEALPHTLASSRGMEPVRMTRVACPALPLIELQRPNGRGRMYRPGSLSTRSANHRQLNFRSRLWSSLRRIGSQGTHATVLLRPELLQQLPSVKFSSCDVSLYQYFSATARHSAFPEIPTRQNECTQGRAQKRAVGPISSEGNHGQRLTQTRFTPIQPQASP